MSASKDYYATLGVDKKATQDEIKRAYRKLARKYHPDLNPDNPEAEARIKEIQEANEVLSDPARRKEYDTPEGGAAAPRPGGPTKQRPAWDFDGAMKDIFGGAGGAGGGGASASRGGASRERPRRKTSKQSFRQEGNNFYTSVTINALQALLGTKVEITNPAGKTIRVPIRAGTESGHKLKLNGQGGARGGKRKDLYVEITVTGLTPEEKRKIRDWATREGLM